MPKKVAYKCGETREKVYCSECKWFYEKSHREYTDQECNNPKNLGNWRDRRTTQQSPKEINKWNNCPWFEKLVITEGYLKEGFKKMGMKIIGD